MDHLTQILARALAQSTIPLNRPRRVCEATPQFLPTAAVITRAVENDAEVRAEILSTFTEAELCDALARRTASLRAGRPGADGSAPADDSTGAGPARLSASTQEHHLLDA